MIKTFSKRKCKGYNTSVTTSTSGTQISVSEPLSTKRNQGCLEKWLVLELRHEKYKINHKHFVAPDSKMLKKDGPCQMTEANVKELLAAKGGTI